MSHLWNFVEEVQQGTPIPPLNFLVPILHLGHTIHVVYGECYLQPLTHDKLSLVEDFMSGNFSFPLAKDAMRLMKGNGEKKRKRQLLDMSNVDRVTGAQSTPVLQSSLPQLRG